MEGAWRATLRGRAASSGVAGTPRLLIGDAAPAKRSSQPNRLTHTKPNVYSPPNRLTAFSPLERGQRHCTPYQIARLSRLPVAALAPSCNVSHSATFRLM